MPARLQTFGHLRLLDEGGNDIVFPEKALLILCYLLTRGVSDMPRAEAASLFWDDEHSASAFANLRQTVSRVQKRQRELDRSYLTFTDTTIALGAEPIESDVGQVSDGTSLTVLAGLLTEDFLKYVRPGNRAFSSWIALQRTAHMAVLRGALLDGKTHESGMTRQARSAAALRLLEGSPEDDEVRAVLTGRPLRDRTRVAAAGDVIGRELPVQCRVQLHPDSRRNRREVVHTARDARAGALRAHA